MADYYAQGDCNSPTSRDATAIAAIAASPICFEDGAVAVSSAGSRLVDEIKAQWRSGSNIPEYASTVSFPVKRTV
jgi:hypothetical protein